MSKSQFPFLSFLRRMRISVDCTASSSPRGPQNVVKPNVNEASILPPKEWSNIHAMVWKQLVRKMSKQKIEILNVLVLMLNVTLGNGLNGHLNVAMLRDHVRSMLLWRASRNTRVMDYNRLVRKMRKQRHAQPCVSESLVFFVNP